MWIVCVVFVRVHACMRARLSDGHLIEATAWLSDGHLIEATAWRAPCMGHEEDVSAAFTQQQAVQPSTQDPPRPALPHPAGVP